MEILFTEQFEQAKNSLIPRNGVFVKLLLLDANPKYPSASCQENGRNTEHLGSSSFKEIADDFLRWSELPSSRNVGEHDKVLKGHKFLRVIIQKFLLILRSFCFDKGKIQRILKRLKQAFESQNIKIDCLIVLVHRFSDNPFR